MRLEAWSQPALLAAWLGASLLATLPVAGVRAETTEEVDATRRWLGPDGALLPFVGDDDVLGFLREARVVSRETLDVGINREEKVLLESNGVRAHAIFRKVDHERQRVRLYGRYFFRFVDHHGGECAAYELARSLGFHSVPPTVARRLGTTAGSLQLWIEGARDETAEDFRHPRPMEYVRQVWDRSLFDNLIFNVDRNSGNVLAGPDHWLWLYDHGQAFQPQGELLAPEVIQKVNRRAWERLKAMSDDELRGLVSDYLDTQRVDALLERRRLVLERVQALVDEKGEATVFY